MENESVEIRRKIPRTVIIRAPGLLNMLYKPSELEVELEIPAYTFRTWTKHGMPFQRDHRGRLWINGVALASWVETVQRHRPRLKLKDDEAFCLRCHDRVKLTDPVISHSVKPPLLTGICPRCGGVVNRGIRR